MMNKPNCWEFMKCGREPGGRRAAELGICPVATATQWDGINGGVEGGRFCWAISGSLCKGQIQGHFARKLGDCFACPFYETVLEQEERGFILLCDDVFQDE